jgi:hypothetical protein
VERNGVERNGVERNGVERNGVERNGVVLATFLLGDASDGVDELGSLFFFRGVIIFSYASSACLGVMSLGVVCFDGPLYHQYPFHDQSNTFIILK